MKKSFTLLELLISITLFLIVIVFLYKTLDQTKHSNNLFSKKEQSVKEINSLYKIFLEDIAESKTTPKIQQDRDRNSIITFKSDNTYHSAYHDYITYLISSNNKLVRIESRSEFKLSNTAYDFYENGNSYIDILLEDIEFFEVVQNSKKDEFTFVIKQKNKQRVIFKTFKIGPNSSTTSPSSQGSDSSDTDKDN